MEAWRARVRLSVWRWGPLLASREAGQSCFWKPLGDGLIPSDGPLSDCHLNCRTLLMTTRAYESCLEGGASLKARGSRTRLAGGIAE